MLHVNCGGLYYLHVLLLVGSIARPESYSTLLCIGYYYCTLSRLRWMRVSISALARAEHLLHKRTVSPRVFVKALPTLPRLFAFQWLLDRPCVGLVVLGN
jgi:hypothetical protein